MAVLALNFSSHAIQVYQHDKQVAQMERNYLAEDKRIKKEEWRNWRIQQAIKKSQGGEQKKKCDCISISKPKK